jgi:hypothetical protein
MEKRFKNINEEISRIKTIISINEQLNLRDCEVALEKAGYDVKSPNERSVSCDSKKNMKCIEKVLNTNEFSNSNWKFNYGKTKSDCFLLAWSVSKVGGSPLCYITFYETGNAVITLRLNAKNNLDNLVFSMDYLCDGTVLEMTQFQFKGLLKGKTMVANIGTQEVKKLDGSIQLNTSGLAVTYGDYLEFFVGNDLATWSQIGGKLLK